MKTVFALIAFFFITIKCFSQNQLYIHSINDTKLYLIDLDNCSSKVIGNTPKIMYDLAMSPDGQLYGISSSRELYLLDSKNGSGVLIASYNSIIINALVYGFDGFLYAANTFGDIYKINPTNGSSTLLGNCGYPSGGDLTFYEGTLYLSGRFGELVKIALPNVSQSKLIGTMNASNIFGIITVGSTACDGSKPKVYATGDNQLFEVDLTNAKVKQVCSLPIFAIGGAASLAEASKISKKKAGKDSTITVCYKSSTKLDLNQYLTPNDIGGVWKDIDNSNSLTNNGLLSPSNLKSGIYKFQYTVGTGICTDTATIKVDIREPIKIDKLILTSPDCNKKNGSIQINIINPISLEYSINAQPFQSSNIFSNLDNGEYKIKFRSQTGCELDTAVKIISSASPLFNNIDIKNTSCGNTNGSINVISDNNTTFSLDDLNYQSSNQFNNLIDGSYTIHLKNSGGCKNSKNVVIKSSDSPQITNVIVEGTTCNLKNGSIKITASGGVGQLQFSYDKLPFTYNTTFNNIEAGNYDITVKDSLNCIISKTVQITSSSSPKIVQIKAEPSTCDGADGKILVIADGGVAPLLYAINNVNFTTVSDFISLTDGNYEVFVKDNKNCISSQKVVLASNCKNSILLPTAFSPNNDGINDFLSVYFSVKSIKIKDFEVFNRWGNLVFSLDKNNTMQSGQKLWNGEDINGLTVIEGVYTYLLNVEFDNGEIHTYRNPILVVF